MVVGKQKGPSEDLMGGGSDGLGHSVSGWGADF